MPIHFCIINLLFCEKFKIKLLFVRKVVGLFVQVEKKIILQNTAAAVSSWMWLCVFFVSYRQSKMYCLVCVFVSWLELNTGFSLFENVKLVYTEFIFPKLSVVLINLKYFQQYAKHGMFSVSCKLISKEMKVLPSHILQYLGKVGIVPDICTISPPPHSVFSKSSVAHVFGVI